MNPIQHGSVVPRSIVLVPITDPSARHDADLCEGVNKEEYRWYLSRRCALLQGQVTSNSWRSSPVSMQVMPHSVVTLHHGAIY